MIRLGKFDKQGYKDSFSKGELARELVCMNNDYDKLEKENQKYKEVINKAINYINNNIIGIDIKSDNIMLNRTELLDILKEVEHEKSNN